MVSTKSQVGSRFSGSPDLLKLLILFLLSPSRLCGLEIYGLNPALTQAWWILMGTDNALELIKPYLFWEDFLGEGPLDFGRCSSEEIRYSMQVREDSMVDCHFHKTLSTFRTKIIWFITLPVNIAINWRGPISLTKLYLIQHPCSVVILCN
jgi:hypothetical protein